VHHNLVLAVSEAVFILTAAGLLFVEVLTRLSGRTDQERQPAGLSHRNGYTGLVSSVLAGPAPKVLRRRALIMLTVSGIIAVVALLA
jgi:hypothetical protein